MTAQHRASRPAEDDAGAHDSHDRRGLRGRLRPLRAHAPAARGGARRPRGILTTRDALLTDYFGVGGIGGGCVNAGLLTLAACLRLPARPAPRSPARRWRACSWCWDSASSARTSSTSGRSSPASMLYARFRREPFAAHINTAFFGAALAPVFSEILFSTSIAARAQRAAGARDQPRRSDSSWRPRPRISSGRTWASASTTWGSPPGSSGR